MNGIFDVLCVLTVLAGTAVMELIVGPVAEDDSG